MASGTDKLRVAEVVGGRWEHGPQDLEDKETDMGRKPSDDYAPGEPGKYGEPYEMIDDVEADEEDEDDD